MGKALMVGIEGASLGSGVETPFGGRFNNATETFSRYVATEGAVFSNLRTRIASGNSGTATFRFRDTGANGAQTFAISGVGANEDAVNSDTLTAGDDFNLGYTDTGTNAVLDYVAVNVAMSSGHGCFHCAASSAAVVADVASATRYYPISGELFSDGQPAASINLSQWKVYGYTLVEAFQVRVTANARLNDSVFQFNVNGSAVGSTITFATLTTGVQTASVGVSLSPGDLVCVQITLGTGVEDLSISFIGATLKSTNNASEIFACNSGSAGRTASATPWYRLPGTGLVAADTTETTERVKPGFAARCSNLRMNVNTNTYTGSCTFSLMVNGVAQITKTIAAGATGWQENNADTFDISATDEISFEIVGGTANAMAWAGLGVTLEEIPAATANVPANMNEYRRRRVA